ncbi:hypothetical protein HBB16_17195 [Pseudonocardia sp. MCCB 268]|nr:hypothetical protein [Pseudonocardia cytotoxica]
MTAVRRRTPTARPARISAGPGSSGQLRGRRRAGLTVAAARSRVSPGRSSFAAPEEERYHPRRHDVHQR